MNTQQIAAIDLEANTYAAAFDGEVLAYNTAKGAFDAFLRLTRAGISIITYSTGDATLRVAEAPKRNEIAIYEVDITEIAVGAQIIVPTNLEGFHVDVVATVTREARDAGCDRFVALLAEDGAGEQHKIVRWYDAKLKVISAA
ncbi:hypothetical protein SEA_SICARIUS2_6 [Arthrobacter phage Sicarius2]|uniref:Uncharacterized protein n=1 Tax=Arthrobacter phage Sicarius2 TaxID=2836090 RepID=A0A8F3EBN2_9CAUD|nr:hypothetical protein SEA_SICARIUS2_6 [Arthrobacter phage Sicarius2]